MDQNLQISPQTFSFLASFLYQNSGLVLQQTQLYLLQNRLLPLISKYKLFDLESLATRMKQGDRVLERLVIESLVTHESSFFRDRKIFDFFEQTFLTQLLEKKENKRLNIWSAACSSGQEPYSLAMILHNFLKTKASGWYAKILATDISEQILEKAKSGTFSHFEIQRGLPAPYMVQFFRKVEEDTWSIDPMLKSFINFQYYNLIKPSSTFIEKFDIIFCRNVLIYFDDETKRKVLKLMTDNLEPGGYVVLGSSELVLGCDSFLKTVSVVPGVFEKL
jgi:chemotaxis protein methyltransferase CheR